MESGDEPAERVSPEPEPETKDVPEDVQEAEPVGNSVNPDRDNVQIPAGVENDDVSEENEGEPKTEETNQAETHKRVNEDTSGDVKREEKDEENTGDNKDDDDTPADETTDNTMGEKDVEKTDEVEKEEVVEKKDEEDTVVPSPHAEDQRNKPAANTANVSSDEAKPEAANSIESTEPSGHTTARSSDTPECIAKPGPQKDDKKDVEEVPAIASSDTNPSPDPTLPSPEPETKKVELAEPQQGRSRGPSQGTSHDISPNPAPGPNPSVLTHRSGPQSRTSLSLDHMAIAASSQNKLPSSRLKCILERLSKHTESSAGKRGPWYKSDTGYVDMNSYSWKNLAMYKDYQQQMWTDSGTIKLSCKK